MPNADTNSRSNVTTASKATFTKNSLQTREAIPLQKYLEAREEIVISCVLGRNGNFVSLD